MPEILPKVYKLYNSVQNYKWGTKGDEAVIPKILGVEPEPNQPYAELWIGAHFKAPSKIKLDKTLLPLDQLIDKYPLEILGKRIADKFGNQLPYLLKLLSSAEALSIQAHPDKTLAKVLHEKDPVNYPDENHKPEIAVAIDGLNVIAGFRPKNEIIEVIQKYPVLLELTEIEDVNDFDLKKFYSNIMTAEEDPLKTIIDEIHSAIDSNRSRNIEEEEFLRQFEKYGFDVGLISILIFNYVTLDRGEAIATKAGVPHSYLKGNIIECMANSDNVVRAGLTPKFKDVKTLIEMLEYSTEKVEIVKRDNSATEFLYSSDANEFSLLNIIGKHTKIIDSNNDVIIGFVLEGEVIISHETEISNGYEYKRGEAFLIPALLKKAILQSSENSNYFLVLVP